VSTNFGRIGLWKAGIIRGMYILGIYMGTRLVEIRGIYIYIYILGVIGLRRLV
jgi:hypothetical protein